MSRTRIIPHIGMNPVVRLLIAVGIVFVAILMIAMIWSSGEDKQVGSAIVPSAGQRIAVSPELKYDDRYQVLAIPRGADDVMCVVVVDRTTGETKSFQCMASCRQ